MISRIYEWLGAMVLVINCGYHGYLDQESTQDLLHALMLSGRP